MFIRRCTIGLFFICAWCMLRLPPAMGTEYDYINITNPFLRKIPIAIPVFKAESDLKTEGDLCRKSSDLLAESLEFTSYFNILDRRSFLFDPQKDSIVTQNINYKNWTVIGAELLVTGGVAIQNGIVQMELRLIDTFKSRMLIGKRYHGKPENYREMVRRFCNDVILTLTGREGIFNSKIAFISNGTGNKEIFVCDFDGYNPKQFTDNRAITLFPAWSSDGKWMAYTSYKNKTPELFIRHIEENRGTIVSREGINSSPCWIPGVFELGATLSFSGDPEIYRLTGNGKIIKRLTNQRGIDSSPSFSPDGKEMAFVSERSGTPQIYIKNLATGNIRRLTFQGRYNTQPSWSPYGGKIAFSSMDNGNHNIHVIGEDGSGHVQLTWNSGNNESPSWSPDGSLIVFSSSREGLSKSKIYVMTAFGTDQRRLLNMPGQQTNPKWSPGYIKD
ncbi:MAG: Tol-Pal system beta propeller repeat protein TolB [Desulfobacterales bacterium]